MAQRVLVVDDDENLLRATVRALRHDYHVTTARTASETLAVVQRQPIDVAIIDFRLGDHEPDGIALIGQVKAAAPAIACVLYSAFAHTQLAVEAIQAGATDVVSKTEQARTILALQQLQRAVPELESRHGRVQAMRGARGRHDAEHVQDQAGQ